MSSIFDTIKGLLQKERVRIDTDVFRLHHTYTVFIIVVFIIFVCTKQFAGDPVKCVHTDTDIPDKVWNTYCWIHGTYIVPSAMYKKIGKEVPAPGVDGTDAMKEPDKVRFLYYYQWVIFILLFQATMFYIPRWIWVSWEGGTLKVLTMDLDISLFEESKKAQNLQILADYFHSSWNTHNWYARRYLFCVVLCVLNVVGQAFMLDTLLNEHFFTYGMESINYFRYGAELSPMIRIFPRMSKCEFLVGSQSGDIDKSFALCIMGLNSIFDKIFLFIWFWFVFVFILTILGILFYLILILCPPFRVFVLCYLYGYDHKKHIRILVREASFGDWFLLYLLAKNIDFIVFRSLLRVIACKIEDSKDPGEDQVRVEDSTQFPSDPYRQFSSSKVKRLSRVRKADDVTHSSQEDQLEEKPAYSIQLEIGKSIDQDQTELSKQKEADRELQSIWVRFFRSAISWLNKKYPTRRNL